MVVGKGYFLSLKYNSLSFSALGEGELGYSIVPGILLSRAIQLHPEVAVLDTCLVGGVPTSQKAHIVYLITTRFAQWNPWNLSLIHI